MTGKGLASVLRQHYPKWLLWSACMLLFAGNLVNAGADLAGMAEATAMVSGIAAIYWTPAYALLMTALLFWSSYRFIASVFRWLTLVLFAYILTGFLVHADWREVAFSTFVPRVTWSREFFSVLVALLGTTISPYLFFWQASQEVEEIRSSKKNPGHNSRPDSRADVIIGMFVSNLIMYFIILTAAATLHAHGQTSIASAREAAESLRPLAGNAAYWLFSLGLVGTGFLGVPALVGSSAYAVAEAARWRASLDAKPRQARQFYAVLALAMLAAIVLDYSGISPIKMLFWSAIINGLLAPPLVLLVVLLTSSKKVMGSKVNSPLLRSLGWATFVVMSAAALGLILTM